MKILITGATGFIGSHITQNLVKEGHQVYAICRNQSNFDKCSQFKSQVTWINQDQKEWELELQELEINQFIHTAWAGVTAAERNDWSLQLTNFEFSKSTIDLAIRLKARKIICLGSQAEYGLYNEKVTEKYVPEPVDAYGAVKLLTLYYLQNVAITNGLDWYWLRIFSILGENENKSWLLSQVMSKLLSNEEIELTSGEQFYDYLYIEDLLRAMTLIINSETNYSSVYNVCSGRPVQIKQLLISLAERLNCDASALKIGTLPYRPNQNMFMVGSPEKFETVFGHHELTNLDTVINKITNSFKATRK